MKIALVQFYEYHEEVLAPQISFLENDHNIFLAAPKTVFNNEYISFYRESFNSICFTEFKYLKSLVLFRIISIINKYIFLYKNHRKYRFDLIVFNTITKNFHYSLIHFLFNKVKNIQIIHNLYPLTKNNGKYLNRFFNNLFLSHDIHQNFVNSIANANKETLSNWFCPLLPINFISDYKSENIVFDNSVINIVIPGSVDERRRNYASLFEALKKYIYKKNLKFKIHLIGKISFTMIEKLKNYGIESLITYFTSYVSSKDMLYCIKNADAVVFLIDSKIGENYILYNNYKVSGTTNLCLSFGTPCVVSDEYKIENALRDKAIFYPNDDIGTVLEKIENGNLTKEHFSRLRSLPLNAEYSFENQKNRYLNALGII